MTLRYLSVCSGIEAASVAWHPFGWEPVGFCEIEPFPSAVLAHHYPGVPNYGDFTQIARDPAHPVRRQRVDLLVGGTPCQDFSVAGLRAGLDGKRGQLTLEFFRLAAVLNPEWIVWENVPGVLSQDGGRAFGAILGALDELGFGWAYRVLDAQYVRVDGYPRAVPQRRRRVFVVGCRGGDRERAERVLLEPEGVLGHSPPRRKAGAGAAGASPSCAGGDGGEGVAGALGSGVGSAGGVHLGADEVAAGHIAVDLQNTRIGSDVVGTLDTTRPTRGEGQAVLEAYGGNDTRGALNVATACRAKGGSGHGDFESETFLVQAYMPARSLAADGGVDEHFAPRDVCDALHTSSGNSGNKAPLLAEAVHLISIQDARTGDKSQNGKGWRDDGVAFTLDVGSTPAVTEAYQQHGSNVGPMGTLRRGNGNEQGGVPFMVDDGVAHTLRAEGHDASEDGTGRGPPLTIDAWTGDNETADPVSAVEMKTYTHEGNNFRLHNCVSERPCGRVRRLTPRECERLQGFPDGYTLISTNKRSHRDPEMIAYLRRQRPNLTDAEIAKLAADGPRYKAIGNSMAVNVMRWIGAQIVLNSLRAEEDFRVS